MGFNRVLVVIGGAGGNRTPVRFGFTVRDTTIPEFVDYGIHAAGSDGPKRPHRRIFLRCQRSFLPSAVFPCCPPLLLLPGCSDQAPGIITGPNDSLTPVLGGESDTRIAVSLCAPFWSLSNSGRTIRRNNRYVETDQPLVKEHC